MKHVSCFGWSKCASQSTSRVRSRSRVDGREETKNMRKVLPRLHT
uniref:Uncharacterized protein n=1 Tax=viral metagenome TaxID=1070528 RepID=A0A6C0J037_9ZZZZ